MGLAIFSLFRQFTSPTVPLNNNNNNNNVEEKRTYGYELRVTLHHCNMILYTLFSSTFIYGSTSEFQIIIIIIIIFLTM